MKQGKEAEKKLALAVARENSGRRDSRNGINIRPESYFRASYYRAADGKVYDSQGDEHLTEATVGYITKAKDGSGYPPGTFLYISHNDNASANGRNNADLGPQPVKRLKQKVFAEVTKQSNGYHWRITYNNARESRQNPIYYFTVPTGQSIQNMKLYENGTVVKQGGVREVFNGASDKYLTSVGAPDSGVNGTPYYENVANTQNAIVGNRGGIYGLDDFVKNNTEVYFNRNGMTEEDKIVTDKLYDKIKNSTQNVFAFRPRDFDRGNTYVVEFNTVGDTEDPLYYIAGMKSYEKIPTGRFMHKSYQQWYGVQERYNITVDTSRLKTTFLKGTGIGTLDTKAGLASSAVTIEDTYTNTRFNPGAGDIGEYYTYKSTGNFSNDYHKQFHNRFVRDFRGGEDGFNMTADRTKGNHTLYIEAVVRNQKINFRLPYKVVTQSDIYQPIAKAATGVKDYTRSLGSASDYITEYRYNPVPGFKEPNSDDMETPNSGLSFYKDRISDFPKTSARIKEQSVKSVEWAGGTNDLTTGTRVIELTVENGRKELFKVPYDIDVVPGGKISAENVAKLNAAIREAYQKVDTNGNVSGTVPTVTPTTPVWVQKQIKVTYYDNENNARTNNQDDSVDYVDVLFKNIRKEATPTAPTISVPEDGSASVTPKGTTDKLVVSYRPTNQNADTTITVKKSGTTWGAVDTLPNGVSVNSSNGVVSITEPTVKDLSTITAKATYLNSDEASATGVAKNPDNVAPTVTLNGTTLTDNASNKTVHVFRGSSLELPLKYYDNAATGRVNISYKNDGGLPQGVWFNDNANASSNYTINQNGKTVNSQGSYTVRGNVSNTASLGERPITLKVSDSADGNVDSGNKKEVKFNVRTYDIEPNSTKVTVEKGTTLSAQDAKAAVTKVNGALDLPEGTTYEWVDTNGRNQTVTPNTAGVQNYRVKVTLPSSETGNNAAFRSSKIVNVSVNVRPEAPTITTEEKYKGTLVSTERSISGTGQPRAKVKITLQDGTTVREVTVENNGKWKYNLAPDEKLTQNDKDSTVKASNPISVKQVVNNIESVAKTVDVQMGRAISIATPVKAGRDISVTLPHDTALFYLQIKNGSNTVQYDVQLVDGNWKILNVDKVGTTELKVSNGDNISEKVFTLHIKDSNKKENIPFRINADTTIQVRAHYVNNRNNPANPTNDGGWATASPATNTNPDISVVNQNATYNSDGTLTKDKLKTLVNVTDAEDDNNKTVGNTARENLDVTVTKNGQPVDLTNGKALKQGTYNLTYTTTDAAGERVTKNHTITVNYIVKAKPTINLIQGENVSDELKRSLLQLQDGTEVVNVPNDAIVEFTNLDINTPSDNKTTQATVVLRNGTRLSTVTLNYNVMKKFETVTKVYDFAGEGRNDSPASYYLNPGGLPEGMSWVVKRGNEAEKNADTNDNMKNMLKADGVGTTNYKFGAKYPRGRFTNNPTNDADKLSYMSAFTHKVFDIADSKNVSVSQGTTLSVEQAKAAVKNATGSDTLPNGTTYEWVGNKVANTSGKQTFRVKVTLPPSQTGNNLPVAAQATPSKTINVTVNVTPPKPTFDNNKVTSTSRTITGTLGGLNANSSNTVVSVALNDGTNRVLTSENNGGVRINGNTWTATLPDDVKLRTSVAKNGETTQPTGLTVTTKIKGSTTADDISVVGDVKAVEMGDYSVNATIAGSKHIDVKVPHDAKRIELRFHNSTETSNTPKSIVLVRSQNGGNWQVDSTATPAGVTNVNNFVQAITNTVNSTNKAENLVTITLKESHNNAKLRIKEENASGDNTATYRTGLGLRVDYKPEPRQVVTSVGNWKVVNVTNNKPTLTYRGTEASNVDARKVFPSGTSITKAMLEDLVTVGDREDKVTNEADKPYGTPTIKIVSGLTETPGKATSAGRYTVVLKAVDSQGKESDPLTVYVGVVSTVVKYQPKVGDTPLGDAKEIPVSGDNHRQGESVSYTPQAEITGNDGKVYVPKAKGDQTVTLKDIPQTVDVEYVEKPATATPIFTVGTQNPQTGNVEVTVEGVPEGTKVKLPGITSEKVVTGGKVNLAHNELPENPTTGKGIAQEDGKLPKEGTSDITIPGKLTSAKGEPAREFEVEIPLPIVVPDPEHLTSKEIEKLVDKVKESNSNTIVTADDKGNVTVTDKTTGESVLIPVKDLTVKDFEPVKPTDKVPVKDKAHLTPEEKKQVADKVKAKNPGKEVTVGDDGTATVTDPTTGISHTIPGTDLVNQDFEPVKPTDKVPVKDKAHLTPKEKKQVADKVKAKNPGKEVTVGDDGTVTVTDPTTGISHTIPGTDLVNQDFEPVKPTDKVLVKDKAHLTPEEKKQVADKVKAKNPGKEVTVGDDGTATVTDPTTGISHTIPGTELVNQDFEPVKPTDKVSVKDKSHLTPEEKKQVEDKVKAKNPGKEVTVGDDGTATVTDPTTGISHTIPGTELVNQDFEPVKPTDKVPVKDKSHLTPEEKKQVADKVKAKNPGKEVIVGDDGTATVTDPTTGISHIIPPTDLVIEFAKGDPTRLEVPGLIITKWTDVQGNDLKQPDAKTPSVPGEANEALKPGEIDGYVFVRTEVKGNVVTHIFRKVSSTETSGDDKPQSTPEVPTDNTEYKPETITPNEQTTETENPTAKPKASQNTLPNTGTADGLGIFSTAVASILAGLGLFLPVKKEDEDEEETQKN